MRKSQVKYFAVLQSLLRFTLLMLSGLCSNLYAGEETGTLRYEITPYLWNAAIKGTAAADGNTSPPIDTGYSFISLENLDGVASATFTVDDRQWGFLFDFLYVAYEDTLLESSLLQVTPRLEGTVVEFTGTYSPGSIQDLDIIAGLRQQDINVTLTYLNRKSEQSVTWTDPFAGVIYTWPLTGKSSLTLRGDLGGFGINSDTAVNAEVGFRFQMNKTFSIKFGYRYLKVKFDENDYLYDISLDGFKAGVGIIF